MFLKYYALLRDCDTNLTRFWWFDMRRRIFFLNFAATQLTAQDRCVLKLLKVHFIHQLALARRKGIFCLRVKLPPVYHARWKLHTFPFNAERQATKLWIPIFLVFGLTRPEIEPEFTVPVTDSLSTQTLIGSDELLTCDVIETTFFLPKLTITLLIDWWRQ